MEAQSQERASSCCAPLTRHRHRVSQIIKQSIVELKLQAEDSFVLKVVQLEELLQVRHSVFVIGNAGSGKSQARAAFVRTPITCLSCPRPSIAWGHGEHWRVAANTTRAGNSKPANSKADPCSLTNPIPEDAGAGEREAGCGSAPLDSISQEAEVGGAL